MKSFIKKVLLLIPPIRKQYDILQNLRADNDALKMKGESILQEIESLKRCLGLLNHQLNVDNLPLEKETSYKMEINQSDLAGFEHNFYSAAQIIHQPIFGPYIPTYSYNREYINENHKYYAYCNRKKEGSGNMLAIEIEGYINYQEALKIYELVYFSKGNILQLET